MKGKYTSFYFDITYYIDNLSNIKLVVKVIDNYSKDGAAFGKQGYPRGSIFYARTGGIWQTVWIESVPNVYIKDVKITPNYDNHSVSFLMIIEGNKKEKLNGYVKILDNEEKNTINISKIIPNIEQKIIISENFKSWSPENPYLYKVEYYSSKDVVKSYFGMINFQLIMIKII